jgi:lipopolysaccharide transport system ATP-binding protein
MTETVAVRLDRVSKKYRLFNSRRDRLLEALHPLRKIYHRDFWALRDVDLIINKGHTIGILGVNGSGKSTLLQVISSVLRPTTGTCHVNGRVAALLELGAGFNPDLTGRENVVINAMIMGLDQERIDESLDEVRAFADIGDFFDQPVKTYSSGMFMRVAFAAAVNVDPDILIVDEALAVGDAKFQEKCFRKFRSFQKAGKTILYVTHDRASVTNFCDHAILMHQGQVVETGAPTWIVDRFTEVMTTGALRPVGSNRTGCAQAGVASSVISSEPVRSQQVAAQLVPNGMLAPEVISFLERRDTDDSASSNPLYNKDEVRFGNDGARIIDFLLMDGARANPGSVTSGSAVDLYVKVHFTEALINPLFGFTLSNEQGVAIYGTHSGWRNRTLSAAEVGDVKKYRFRFPISVSAGHCFIELGVSRSEIDVMDVRSRLIYVYVARREIMMGLADLQAQVDEFP